MQPNFQKIFAPLAARRAELKKWQRYFRKADDRRLDVSALTDEQLDRLSDEFDDEITYDEDGNRVRRSDLDKKGKPMDKMSVLEHFVKNDGNGMLKIAKHVVNGGAVNLSEHEFTSLATVAAKRDYPNDRPDVAFSKFFSQHQVVREAHQVVKGTMVMPIMPVYVGGNAVDVNDPEDALAQLEELVAQMRAAAPWMSKAQAFAKVYTDPANAQLAAAERRQNRPRAG